MIREYVANAECLDLFGGSGSVGIEFLSNGAASCDFVEHNSDCVSAIKKNLSDLKELNGHVFFKDSIEFLKETDSTYDIIFIDPPYADHKAYKEALRTIDERKLLKPNGMIVLEYEGDKPPFDNSSFIYSKEKRYGKTKLIVARHS